MKSPSTKFLVVILALAVSAFAQSATKSDTQKADAAKSAQKSAEALKPATESQKTLTEAQKSFAVLKTLAGSWEGVISGVAGDSSAEGKTAHMVLRQTSM